jgi:hypothetical protein
MKYHAPTGQFTVEKKALDMASHAFLFAIKQIRINDDLPLCKYKTTGPMLASDHAMKAIIDGARHLGIDLGAEWGNEIDQSEPEGDQ